MSSYQFTCCIVLQYSTFKRSWWIETTLCFCPEWQKRTGKTKRTTWSNSPSLASWDHHRHVCSICATTVLHRIGTKYHTSKHHLRGTIHIPISPQKRLKVLGMRMCGFTSIRTFFSVCMYTCSIPARLRGLSRSIIRLWWEISGRALEISLPCFTSWLLWSSLFISSNFFPIYDERV